MSSGAGPSRLAVPVTELDHIRGPATAPVTLVEYGDYECPYCGRAHVVVEEVRRIAGDTLRFVFRNFPLSQIHPHALLAAEAAEAAGAQGSFWEMHDRLFEHQDRLSERDLILHAEALGLDVTRFAAELLEHVHAPRVREDFLGGVRSGVNGTPTFFVNGVRHDGGYDLETLLASIGVPAAQTRR
jgi:protein-disulfide isomerase